MSLNPVCPGICSNDHVGGGHTRRHEWKGFDPLETEYKVQSAIGINPWLKKFFLDHIAKDMDDNQVGFLDPRCCRRRDSQA